MKKILSEPGEMLAKVLWSYVSMLFLVGFFLLGVEIAHSQDIFQKQPKSTSQNSDLVVVVDDSVSMKGFVNPETGAWRNVLLSGVGGGAADIYGQDRVRFARLSALQSSTIQGQSLDAYCDPSTYHVTTSRFSNFIDMAEDSNADVLFITDGVAYLPKWGEMHADIRKWKTFLLKGKYRTGIVMILLPFNGNYDIDPSQNLPEALAKRYWNSGNFPSNILCEPHPSSKEVREGKLLTQTYCGPAVLYIYIFASSKERRDRLNSRIFEAMDKVPNFPWKDNWIFVPINPPILAADESSFFLQAQVHRKSGQSDKHEVRGSPTAPYWKVDILELPMQRNPSLNLRWVDKAKASRTPDIFSKVYHWSIKQIRSYGPPAPGNPCGEPMTDAAKIQTFHAFRSALERQFLHVESASVIDVPLNTSALLQNQGFNRSILVEIESSMTIQGKNPSGYWNVYAHNAGETDKSIDLRNVSIFRPADAPTPFQTWGLREMIQEATENSAPTIIRKVGVCFLPQRGARKCEACK